MKVLIVHDKLTGELVFTQTNATEEYACVVEEIPEDKEAIGVELETGEVIVVDRLISYQEREEARKQLELSNQKLLETQEQLGQVSITLAEMDSQLNETTNKLNETNIQLQNKTNELEIVNTQKEDLVDKYIELQAQNLIIDSDL